MIRRAGPRLVLLALAAAAAAAGAAILLAPQPSPPPPPATEHRGEPAGASPPATPASTPSSAPRVDQLARPLTDAEAQQLLEDVTPGTLDDGDAAPVIEQAWAVLSDDMHRGGWSHPRRRAAVVVPVAVDTTGPGGQVDVIIVWSAVTPAGHVDDAGRSTLRLAGQNGSWTVLSLG